MARAAAYMTRYRRAVAALVRQGWLLRADVPALVAAARARADALLPRMRLWLFVLALLAAAPAAAQPAAFGQYRRAADYPDIATSSQYVTMRDGVRLAVRIDRPARGARAADGRFPVIWHHTLSISSTNRDGVGGPTSAIRSMPDLVRYGYVVVQVARRGNGQSFGVRRGYHDRIEAEDAYEMTEWLARQPFSNGRVGIYGCSNTGDAAMHAMAMLPPSLRAVFAGCLFLAQI
jgi:putative hydrolase, CocE/NonD family